MTERKRKGSYKKIKEQDIDSEPCSLIFAYKNLFILSLSFFFLFSSYLSLQNLQSSIHRDPKVGFVSLCVIYGFVTLSSLFLPPIVMNKLGYKYALLLSMFGYLPFVVVQVYAKMWLMVIASIIIGTSASVLWATQSSYVSILATRYGKSIGVNPALVLSKFLSLFYIAMSAGQMFGNFISSLILKTTSSPTINSAQSASKCGPYFCPSTSSSETTLSGHATSSSVLKLSSIYTGLTLLALLSVAGFLSTLKKKRRAVDDHENGKSVLTLFTSTIRLMGCKTTLLLIPVSLFNGMVVAFILGDFTQAYVTCFLGIDHVGYVMACNGVCSVCFGLIMSSVTKWLDSHQLFLSGLLVSMCTLVWSLFYDVSNMDARLVYVTSAMWGLVNVILVAQLFAVYGAHFKENNQEAAFSVLNVFKCLGYSIAFGYGDVLCVEVKIYILIGVLSIAIICFLYVMNCYYETTRNQKSGVLNKDNCKSSEPAIDSHRSSETPLLQDED